MDQNNVVELKKPESFVDDPLTEILRKGARQLLSAALEAEIDTFLSQYEALRMIKVVNESSVMGICRNVKFKPA